MDLRPSRTAAMRAVEAERLPLSVTALRPLVAGRECICLLAQQPPRMRWAAVVMVSRSGRCRVRSRESGRGSGGDTSTCAGRREADDAVVVALGGSVGRPVPDTGPALVTGTGSGPGSQYSLWPALMRSGVVSFWAAVCDWRAGGGRMRVAVPSTCPRSSRALLLRAVNFLRSVANRCGLQPSGVAAPVRLSAKSTPPRLASEPPRRGPH